MSNRRRKSKLSRNAVLKIDWLDQDLTEDEETYLVSYRGAPFTGYLTGGIYSSNRDGPSRFETQYVDGRRLGVSRSWHPNGQLNGEEWFGPCGAHGFYRLWDEQGRLRVECFHEYSILLWSKNWDAEGRLIAEKQHPFSDAGREKLDNARREYGPWSPEDALRMERAHARGGKKTNS